MLNKKLKNNWLAISGVTVILVASIIAFYSVSKKSNTNPSQLVVDSTFSLPATPAVFPALLVKYSQTDTESVPLKMSILKMDVHVIGNIVQTTMEMVFYNDFIHDLEGQFYFPLAEGQSVNRFALQMDDELREGVVVGKTKGRTTYESVIRKRIDPGLLEWSKGNNFKARIFPIPAKGYKKIIIGYTHELLATANTYMYWQPMAFKDPLDKFEIKVRVEQLETEPIKRDQNGAPLEFKKQAEDWVTETKLENFLANKPIAFEIPASSLLNKVFTEKIPNTDSSYFYVCTKPQKFQRIKQVPKKIAIIYDISASASKRDIKKELEIVESYAKHLKDFEIELIPFAHQTFKSETFTIRDGNCKDLIAKLQKMAFDGGTQLGCLNFNKIKADEILFFTDGISNFGKQEVTFSKAPINTFVSSAEADFSFLKFAAQSTNGQFINTLGQKVPDIINLLKNEAYRYLSAELESGSVSQIFPAIPTDYNQSFSIAGKIKGNAAKINLNFGFGNETHKKYELQLSNSHLVKNGILQKIWAQKKLELLDMSPKKNESEITGLGIKHSIITRYTSLLVLDRLEDYIEHEVVPPTGKLHDQYLAQIAKSKLEKAQTTQNHLEEVATLFAQKKAWWNKSFPWPEKKKKTNPGSGTQFRVSENDTSFAMTDSVSVGSVSERSESRQSWSFGNESHIESETFTSNYTTAAGTYSVTLANDANASEVNSNIDAKITLNKWEPDAAYMKPLKAAKKDQLYQTYLNLRSKNSSTPAYYFDVSDIMLQQGMPDQALRVLSNIAELELENHELLRTLAHRLQQLKKYDLAIESFKSVLKIREEEPQSYRDLGLAYADNEQYQQAVDMLCKVINQKWDSRFPEIELIAIGEINTIIAKSKSNLNLDALDKRFHQNLPTDMRIVIDWDSDNCDMDLWVTDPSGEKTFYSHALSTIGGRISRDFTGGYGPEEFLLKRAMPGKYKIQVDYYGSSRQTVSGPTTVQAKLISNFGRKSEKCKEVTIRLKTAKEVIDIGELVF
jgi:tetratricopeptide (TPR) repeat protein